MNNWTVRRRIVVSFGVSVMLMLLVGALALYFLRSIATSTASIEADSVPGLYFVARVQAIASLDRLLQSLQQKSATFGKSSVEVLKFRLDHGDLHGALTKAGAGGADLRAKILGAAQALQTEKDAADAAQKKLQALQTLQQQAKSLYESTRTPLENYISAIRNYFQLLDKHLITQEFLHDPGT